jgi:hypothetical protein
MDFQPIEGRPLRFPPGYVEVRLDAGHRRLYRALYARYSTILDGLPVLRDRDFDGRAVKMPAARLEAMNAAFQALTETTAATETAFGAQEAGRTGLFKRLQYLS